MNRLFAVRLVRARCNSIGLQAPQTIFWRSQQSPASEGAISKDSIPRLAMCPTPLGRCDDRQRLERDHIPLLLIDDAPARLRQRRAANGRRESSVCNNIATPA